MKKILAFMLVLSMLLCCAFVPVSASSKITPDLQKAMDAAAEDELIDIIFNVFVIISPLF